MWQLQQLGLQFRLLSAEAAALLILWGRIEVLLSQGEWSLRVTWVGPSPWVRTTWAEETTKENGRVLLPVELGRVLVSVLSLIHI